MVLFVIPASADKNKARRQMRPVSHPSILYFSLLFLFMPLGVFPTGPDKVVILNPRICVRCPLGRIEFITSDVDCVHRERREDCEIIVPNWYDGQALVAIVVRLHGPVRDLFSRGCHDVRESGRIDHDGKAHSPRLQASNDPVHNAIPSGHLIVNPQPIQTRSFHQIQLGLNHVRTSYVIGAQVTGIIRIPIR